MKSLVAYFSQNGHTERAAKEIAEATKVSINTALGRMRYAILNMRRIADENNIVLTL